jgi:membrane protein
MPIAAERGNGAAGRRIRRQTYRMGAVSAKSALERFQQFFGSRIWSASLNEVRRSRALLYRASRIVYATVQGFREKDLTFRAAALTYYSVLSIVPFLAFAFSVLKGFGGYQKLLDGTVRPYLRDTFAGNPTLLAGMEQMLVFVERTSTVGLNTVSVILLVYTSISMLSTIETALNDIWGAKSARPVLRQVTDYTTLLVVTPLLMAAAVTFGTAARSSGVVTFLRETMLVGTVIEFMLSLTSLVFGCVAMIALYIIMPNVKTRLSSALFGGIIGGLLWQGALLVHVKFQMGVANYNALYSGFGAVPIFLVWVYVSWTIVLLGAQLAASHQYEQTMRQAIRAKHVDQELRETLSIAIAAEVTKRFMEGCPPRTQASLAESLEVPPPTVEDVLNQLVKAGVLIRAVCGHDLGYLPARDVDTLRVSDVRAAVRRIPEAAELKSALDRRVSEGLRQLLHAAESAEREGPANLTLRELALTALEVNTPREMPESHSKEVEILDAKQPEVPS